jgi:hypothetical protein
LDTLTNGRRIVKKAFDSAFRKAANPSRARLAVLATTMLVLGIALSTGAAALATDSRDQTDTYSKPPDTTSTHETTDTTTSTTSTSTQSTSVPSTVSVAGTTAAGVAPAPAAGGGPGGGQGGGGAPAAQAPAGNGQLPFTGVHVPALIVIALGMIAGGIALRRKLEDSA